MPTSEVYRIGSDGKRTYAGYAKFGNDGSFQGTRGGNGRTRAGRYSNTSEVRRTISTVGMRQAARQRRAGL